MSYSEVVVNSQPLVYLPLNETSGTTALDASGHNTNFTYLNAAASNRTPTVNSGGPGQLFTGTQQVSGIIPLDTFSDSNPNAPFMFSIWVLPVAVTGEEFICGRSPSANNGLFIYNSGFVLKLNSTGGVQTLFFPVRRMTGLFHVAVVYTGDTISLWVNGESVQMDVLGTLVTGNSTTFRIADQTLGTTKLVLGHFSYHPGNQTNRLILDLLNEGIRTNDYVNAVLQDQGNLYNLDDTAANILFDVTESNLSDFMASNAVVLNNLVFDNNFGLTNSDPTVSGVREALYDISTLGVIAGSRIDWDSSSPALTVQTSLDNGATWQSATNHSQISGLTNAIDTTGKTLRVRHTFGVSGTYDIPSINRNRIVIYADKNLTPINGSNPINATSGVILAEWSTSMLYKNDITAASTDANNYFDIPTSPDGDPVTGVEFFVRRDIDTTATIVDFRASNYVLDSFDRANGAVGNAESGQAWRSDETDASSWTISGNALSIASIPVNGLEFISIDTGSAIQDVQTTVGSLTASGYAGIAVRYQDKSNNIYFQGRGTTGTLYKLVNGVQTTLATATTPSIGAGTVIRVFATENVVKVYINGTEVISVNDTSFYGNTRIALLGFSTAASGAITYSTFSTNYGTEFLGISGGALTLAGWGSVYINGVLKSPPTIADFPLGIWTHVFLVPTNPLFTKGRINGNFTTTAGIIGYYQYISVYHTPIDAVTPLKHYNSAYNKRSFRYLDTDPCSITEIGWNAYNYAWQG